MSKTRFSAIIFFALAIISIAVPLFYYPLLPQNMASHFNFKNEADGWMSKRSFFAVQIAVTFFLWGMFLLIAGLLHKFPDSAINLPNKNFWLSRFHREETMSTLKDFFYWIGNITMAFMLLLFLEVYKINMNGSLKMDSKIWMYTILFIAALTFLITRMILHFNKTEKSI